MVGLLKRLFGFGRNGKHSFAKTLLNAYGDLRTGPAFAGYTNWRNDPSRWRATDVVAKARWMEQNSSLANRLARLYVDYTVGPNGLQLFPSSISERWNDWAREQWLGIRDTLFTGPAGANGWAGGIAMVAWRTFFDGEIFLYLAVSQDGDPIVQVIERQDVVTPPSPRKSGATEIVDGIEVDTRTWQPVAYHVRVNQNGKDTYQRIAASAMIHVYDPARADEFRGSPIIAPVLQDLMDLMEFEELEKRAMQNAADLAVILKLNSGDLSDVDIRAQLLGVAAEQNQNVIDETQRIQLYREVLGGRTVALQRDEDATVVQPHRPTQEQQAFWKWIARKVCLGVNIPPMMVIGEDTQGTLVRAQVESANNYFRSSSVIYANVAKRIYRHAIDTIARRVNRPRPNDWDSVTVRPPKQIIADAGYLTAAALNELKAGVTNWELIYGALGLDAREELRKKAELAAYIRQLSDEYGVPVTDIANLEAQPTRINRQTVQEVDDG